MRLFWRKDASKAASDARRHAVNGAAGRGVSRRAFTAGTLAAGAGLAAITLTSCSDNNDDSTGEPQVVTDDSQIVDVIEDYENVDNTLAATGSWSLPLGTMLFHTGGVWAAAMLTPESARQVNTLGVLSLSSGNLFTLVEEPTQGATYGFFDVRCSGQVMAWVEVDYATRAWALIAQGFSDGTLTGSAVKLDEGDVDWEPARFTVWESSVIWQKMPLATGSKSAEDSHCYLWSLGDSEGTELWTSHGRFATAPRVSAGILTIAPRVRDEGTYYGMTAIDLTDSDRPRRAQLVLPRGVAPFDATYINEQFVFSIEASYNGVGSLGNMGTFMGNEGGPYLYVRREPLACASAHGSRYVVKSRASHFIVDTEAKTYAVLTAPDRSIEYGDWPASEGDTDMLLTYATVRNEQGLPASVTARVFAL